MANQIKVLMLLPNLRVSNGVASYAMNYFRQLNYDTVYMDFAVYNNRETPYVAEIEAAGGHVYVLPPLKNLPTHYKACRELLKNGCYDIVHDNTLLISIPLMAEAKRQNVPVRILHSHSSKLGGTVRKEKRNAVFLPLLRRQANAYAACSDLAAKALFGNAEYAFIPNFIDADKFAFDPETRQRVRAQMGVGDKIIIATVGRTAPEKNPFFAMDVLDRVIDSVPNVEYWWIGSGPLDQEIDKYVKKMRHADQVMLLGSRDDVRDLYQAMDLFFLPSLFEGLPVTGIEAQAVGLPCVVSDTVTKEMVYTDLVQYISIDKSTEKWAEIICNLLTRTGMRRSYREELLASQFSSRNAGMFLENYYCCLIKCVET